MSFKKLLSIWWSMQWRGVDFNGGVKYLAFLYFWGYGPRSATEGVLRPQTCSALPKASSAASCMPSLIVGCGKTVAKRSASVASRVMARA